MVSFSCGELIRELKYDILEFGTNAKVVVWCRDIDGITVYTNYDFATAEMPVAADEIQTEEYIQIMTAGELLPLLERQNAI